MLKNPRMPAGWVVTAMCEEPGYAYPEMFSLVERTPGELEVAVMSEAHGAYSLPSDDGQDAPGEEELQPQAEAAPSPPSPPSPPAQEEEGSGDADGEHTAFQASGIVATGSRRPSAQDRSNSQLRYRVCCVVDGAPV